MIIVLCIYLRCISSLHKFSSVENSAAVLEFLKNQLKQTYKNYIFFTSNVLFIDQFYVQIGKKVTNDNRELTNDNMACGLRPVYKVMQDLTSC